MICKTESTFLIMFSMVGRIWIRGGPRVEKRWLNHWYWIWVFEVLCIDPVYSIISTSVFACKNQDEPKWVFQVLCHKSCLSLTFIEPVLFL